MGEELNQGIFHGRPIAGASGWVEVGGWHELVKESGESGAEAMPAPSIYPFTE
jgi:hypothetical protein